MRRVGILILTICTALIAQSHAFVNPLKADTADFTLVKISDDIAVYERWYPLSPQQNAREIKAAFVVRADPWDAAALIQNESLGRRWNPRVKTYKVLSPEATSWVCYIEYDLPWPVSNQDCVLEYKLHHSQDLLEVSFKGIEHPLFPLQKRIERIPDIRGKWIFTRTTEGLAVEYYITTTPSSTLPSWLTDPIIRNNLIVTLASFRKMLERETPLSE